MDSKRALIIGTVIVIVGIARFSLPAHSTALTPGATQRLSVYGGIVTITPGDIIPDTTTERTLELGTLGTDIAANDDIILQPGSTSTSDTRFIGRGGLLQDLSVSGNISLETNGKEICLKGVCRTSWSRVSEHWQARTLSYGTWDQTILQPVNINEGMRIGTGLQRFMSGTALTVDGLFVTNRAGGNAATVSGSVEDISNLTVYKNITVSYREPWSQRLQGEGTGLDADKIDGTSVVLRNGYACNATACVCFHGTPTNHTNISFTSGQYNYRCLRLFPTSAPPY